MSTNQEDDLGGDTFLTDIMRKQGKGAKGKGKIQVLAEEDDEVDADELQDVVYD